MTLENRQRVKGVVEAISSGKFPLEFMKGGHTFEEALSRTILVSELQANLAVICKAHLDMFNSKGKMESLIDMIINKLNSNPSVGGFNRSLAAQVAVGIFSPSAAGVKLDKDIEKATLEAVRGNRKLQFETANRGNGKSEPDD